MAGSVLFLVRHNMPAIEPKSAEFDFGTEPTRQYYQWMDTLTLFGLFAVTAMLVFYALEERSSWCVLGFAAACALGSAYGFLQGAWPFGLVEAIWAGVAVWRWRQKTAASRQKGQP